MSNSIPLSRAGATVVIGGGIAGATVTYELARRGVRVTLLEATSIADAASGRNMGLLLNQSDRCAMHLRRRSLEVYRELESAGFDFSLRRSDQLLLARDGEQWHVAEARARAFKADHHCVHDLGAAELRRAFPLLAEDVRGGWVVEDAWALDHAAATRAFVEAARSAGADIRTGVHVHALARASGRVVGALTDAGRVDAAAVVVATGARLRELVTEVAVTGARGWVLRTGRLGFDLPWIIEEASWPGPGELARPGRRPTFAELARGDHDRPAAQAVMLVQLPDGDALVGTSTAATLDGAVEGTDMPRRLAERALLAAPGLAGVELAGAWSALRPTSPDGMPIAGAVPGSDGLWVHSGHGSRGMVTAPALARSLVDGAAAELEPFRPDRF